MDVSGQNIGQICRTASSLMSGQIGGPETPVTSQKSEGLVQRWKPETTFCITAFVRRQ